LSQSQNLSPGGWTTGTQFELFLLANSKRIRCAAEHIWMLMLVNSYAPTTYDDPPLIFTDLHTSIYIILGEEYTTPTSIVSQSFPFFPYCWETNKFASIVRRAILAKFKNKFTHFEKWFPFQF
jgi:hypothetical protein